MDESVSNIFFFDGIQKFSFSGPTNSMGTQQLCLSTLKKYWSLIWDVLYLEPEKPPSTGCILTELVQLRRCPFSPCTYKCTDRWSSGERRVVLPKWFFMLFVHHLPVFFNVYSLKILDCPFALVASSSIGRISALEYVTQDLRCRWQVRSDTIARDGVFRFLSWCDRLFFYQRIFGRASPQVGETGFLYLALMVYPQRRCHSLCLLVALSLHGWRTSWSRFSLSKSWRTCSPRWWCSTSPAVVIRALCIPPKRGAQRGRLTVVVTRWTWNGLLVA